MLNRVVSLWSHEKCLGFALAATLADDRTLAHVSATMPEAQRVPVQSLLSQLDIADASHKIRVLRTMAESVRGEISGSGLPPRARALLARFLPKEIGRTFLEGAPQARHDFAPEPELSATLRHFATLSRPTP